PFRVGTAHVRALSLRSRGVQRERDLRRSIPSLLTWAVGGGNPPCRAISTGAWRRARATDLKWQEGNSCEMPRVAPKWRGLAPSTELHRIPTAHHCATARS